jgi:hypothetical protein
VGPVLSLLGQGAPPGELTSWLTGSAVTVLALGIVAFLRRWIVTGAELDRVQAKLDAAEALLRKIAVDDREVLVPALTRATDVLANYVRQKVDATPPPPNRPQSP